MNSWSAQTDQEQNRKGVAAHYDHRGKSMEKMNYSRIDLHMHTTISDGTDDLRTLLENLGKKGIELFSVTDHDAVKGSLLMPRLLGTGDPDFIRGVEFSCRDGNGKYHILGYGYDPRRPAILGLVEDGHTMRMEKTQARIRYLQTEYGMRFPEKEVEELLSLDGPGKPHIAQMMIRHGYASSIDEAIRDYINGRKFPDLYQDPVTVIKAILASGGIPVLAHPAYGSGDELILGEELEARLKRLMRYGLKGVEGFYSGFTDKIQEEVLDLAEKYDLYVTAGSDYHGTIKLVELGDTNLPDAGQAPEGLLRFLRDVKIIKAL